MFFLIIAFFLTPQIQFLISANDFNDPANHLKNHLPEKNTIPENSIILAKRIDKVFEYEKTPFNMETISSWDSKKIELLRMVLNENYPVLVFKSTSDNEMQILKNLTENHNFVLQEYSPTFCKILINQGNSSSTCI